MLHTAPLTLNQPVKSTFLITDLDRVITSKSFIHQCLSISCSVCVLWRKVAHQPVWLMPNNESLLNHYLPITEWVVFNDTLRSQYDRFTGIQELIIIQWLRSPSVFSGNSSWSLGKNVLTTHQLSSCSHFILRSFLNILN